MTKLFTVVNRLPRQPGAQRTTIALDDADAARYVVQQLVAGSEDVRGYGRAVVLQADPARHDNRRRHDQFEHAEVIVTAPIVAMQKGLAGKVVGSRTDPWCGDESLATGERPFRANLCPVAATHCDV